MTDRLTIPTRPALGHRISFPHLPSFNLHVVFVGSPHLIRVSLSVHQSSSNERDMHSNSSWLCLSPRTLFFVLGPNKLLLKMYFLKETLKPDQILKGQCRHQTQQVMTNDSFDWRDWLEACLERTSERASEQEEIEFNSRNAKVRAWPSRAFEVGWKEVFRLIEKIISS